MTELIKAFRHFARDLLIYAISGFAVLVNLAFLDYLFNSANTFKYIKNIQYWIVGVILISYVLGHCVFALMYYFFEFRFKIENYFKRRYFSKKSKEEKNKEIEFEVDYKKEIKFFSSNERLHEQFIERHTQLYLFRWNLAGAFIFSGILNFIFQIPFGFNTKLTLISFLLILLGVLLYILSLRTEKDCAERIEEIFKQIQK